MKLSFIRYLHGIGHLSRAVFVLLGALVVYCVWFWLLARLGVVHDGTTGPVAAILFLLPLVPLAGLDVLMRLSWRPSLETVYSPPPTLVERMMERRYGLYWWPVLICVPVWLWAVGLLGWIAWAGLKPG